MKFKRHREGKTDYRRRLKLLRSGKPRMVVRKTCGNTLVQFIRYGSGGDEVLVTASGYELKKFGWEHSYKNTSAAYLTGMLGGKMAEKKEIKEAVLDLGLHTPTKGSTIFACVKGALDAGIRIPCAEEAIPSQNRIAGKHISEEVVKGFENLVKEVKKWKPSGSRKRS